MKIRKLWLSLAVVFLVVFAAYFALRESPEEQKSREALEEKAKTEVMMRISPTPEFYANSNHESASYYTAVCTESHGWTHHVGVMEAIDVTSPSSGRVYLYFCVNTDSWEIQADNDLAKSSTTDDSAYLDAQGNCFRRTDPANKIRDKVLTAMYGETFLRVRPSGIDVSAADFSCTSSFTFTNSPNQEAAVWRIFPNQPMSDDSPLTVEASRVQQQISIQGAPPEQYSQATSSMAAPNDIGNSETPKADQFSPKYSHADSSQQTSTIGSGIDQSMTKKWTLVQAATLTWKMRCGLYPHFNWPCAQEVQGCSTIS